MRNKKKVSPASVVTPRATAVSAPIPVKQCVGVDVSKDHLEVCFSQMDAEQTVWAKATRTFANRAGGWKALESWIKRLQTAEVPLWLVMEATGVYYEGAAYYFHTQAYQVVVVLPNKSQKYFQSLNLKTKTDAAEASALARMGLERKMKAWRGFSPVMRTLKRLCRERQAIQAHMVAASNQLHAHTHEHQGERYSIQRGEQHLKFLAGQIQAIDQQIEQTVREDAELKAKVERVCTIKGVSTLTAVIIIAETNGFELIQNKAQLVSYAGYDVVERQSGSSVRGKSRISKKGNAHIRRALHYPALSAARHNPVFQAFYRRITERNPKIKMIALVAVQRKLLVLIYTLYKKDTAFDPHYQDQVIPHKNRQEKTPAYTA
jgi:transposase